MIEILAYKNVPYSQYGFQWTVISEWNSQEEADGEITAHVELGNDPRDLKTREKRIPTGKSPDNRHSKTQSGTALRRQWNEGNPAYETGIGKR